MKIAKRLLTLLLALVMVLSVLPFTALAADNEGTTGGIKTNKTYNEETGYLTLEAYVTGESQMQIVSQPVDIALVLDTSGSMENKKLRDDCISFKRGYHFEGPSLLNGYVDYKGSYIQVGTREDLSELDTVYGANEDGEHPVYFLYSVTAFGVYDTLAKMRYSGGQWEYYGWSVSNGWHWRPTSESNYGGGSVYISKLDALKIATKHFIDSAAAASDSTDPNRISIIKFAGDRNNTIGNDRYDSRNTNTGWSNYSQIVQGLTDVNGNVAALKNTVDSLLASGATRADFGMQHAQTVLASTDSSRKKVVIMFTDGEPTSGNTFENNVANGAITAAKSLKGSNTTVYTVGCFSGDPSTNTATYMNYVSSNYPDAVSMTNGGAQKDTKYYSTAATSTDLTGIFQTISQEVGGASVTLTSTSVLKDVVSEYFDLDTDGVDAKAIKVHTETCTAIDADGNPTAWNNDNNYNAYTAVVDGKNVTVTGFDYSANWVGSHNGQPGGKKLVLEIPIKANENCKGVNLPTNGEDTGIYVDGEKVAPFPKPTVDKPYYIVKNVQNGQVVRTTEYLGTHVTLTDKLSENYLYGGGFTDAACTIPSGNGLTGFETAGNGEVYYIWEVSPVYLMPKSLSLNETNAEGQKDVIGFYPMTGIDRLYYQSVGFDVASSTGVSDPVVDVDENNPSQLGSTNVYAAITANFKDGSSVTFRPTESVFADLSESSYLACFSVPQSYWANAGDKITFTPYWITLDGVKVTGTCTRTCQYSGVGSKGITKIEEIEHGSQITSSSAAVQLMLTACGNVVLGESENTPVDPVDPVEPVDPVDPVAPVDPVDPIDPVEPAEKLVVTVHDGSSVYTLEAVAGEDITSRLVSAGMYGKRFAGWFLDERSTAAAELRNVQSNLDVYAKYVSDTYLTLRYRNVGLFRSKNVKLYAALDSADYAEAGFVINGSFVSCPVTKDAYTAFFLFGSSVRENTALVSYTYGTGDLSYGDTVEITPYWVTLDGTTVYGSTQTLTYGRFGLM